MAAIPGGAGGGFSFASAGSFIVNLGANYLLSRVTAQDGPKLGNLAAGGGEYGTIMPRALGEKFRLTGIIIAQADIKETKHTIEDYSEIVGAVTGAVQGFMVGGPVGAVVGGVIGGIFGAVTPNQHYYTYSDTAALLLAERVGDDPIEGVQKLFAAGKTIFNANQSGVVSQTLDADGKLIRRKYGKNNYFKSLTIHAGHANQLVDPVLASVLGETGGYPFSAYLVIEDLQLAEFGNALPSIEALTLIKTGQTLADAAEIICTAAGIDATRDLSTTALTGNVLRGYAVTAQSNCWDALKPLMPAFGVDAAEVSGQIRFYRRSQGLRGTITLGDMGAHAGEDSAPGEPFQYKRATDIDLPKETSLTFIDPARDYQANAATSRRSEGNAQSNVTVTLPLVLSANEGASAAALMHWDAWLGRTALTFSLTDTWIGIEVGLAYAIPFGDQFVPYRMTRRLRGANGIIEMEARSDESVTYHAVVAHTSGTVPEEEPTLLPDTRLILMDMPILEDAHDDFGFYVVMSATEDYWTRGHIDASSNSVTFATLIDSSLQAVMGDVTGTLAAGSTSGLDDTLDMSSVLTVMLLNDGMELQSATDGQLDAYANFGFVGKDGQGEYLQWKTATKVAPKTWELTGLRRGRKGTDWAIAGHSSGEEFAQLGHEGVFRIIYGDASDWGNPMTFRGVTIHQDEADAATVAFTNTGEGKRPYSPVAVAGSWDGGYNLSATFTRRSRFNSGAIGTDAPESYEVDILNAAGSGVVRTIAVSSPAFTYSAAQATTDGLSPGGRVRGSIYQLNPNRGRGHPRTFDLRGPVTLHADTTLTTADTTALNADVA
jgi:hypothetical protein